MDSFRNREGKRRGGKLLGKERKKDKGNGDESGWKKLMATAHSMPTLCLNQIEFAHCGQVQDSRNLPIRVNMSSLNPGHLCSICYDGKVLSVNYNVPEIF